MKSKEAAILESFKTALWLEKGLAPASISAYESDIQSFLKFLASQEDERGIEEVDSSLISRYLSTPELAALRPRSLSRKLSSLKSFFNFLEEEKIITHAPTEYLRAPVLPAHLPSVLTNEQVKSMLATFDRSTLSGNRDYLLLLLLYSCGLRVSEACGLQMESLFPAEGFIRVIGKGDKERLVPAPAIFFQEAERYMSHYHHQINIQPAAKGHIFHNQKGGPLSRVSAFNIVKQAAANAMLSADIHPHTLRHTFATELVKNGADLRAVQAMLGHASITTTEIYTHLDKQHLREVIELYHPLR